MTQRRSPIPPLPDSATQPTRQSLLQTLQLAHVRVAMVSVAAVALTLSVAAVFALRTYAANHLELVARSIAYSVEAAVVFNDRPAMNEQLAAIAEREQLRHAELRDPQGMTLARYEPPSSSVAHEMPALIGDRLAAWLMPGAAVATIVDRGRLVGQIRVQGNGTIFSRFLATAGAGIVLCVVLLGLGMRVSSRRLRRDIVAPVQALIAMTHAARAQGGALRAPASNIAEFHELGEDFNALLSEIESQQAQLAQENRSLTHLANHDSLTGLYNRAFFRRRLARVLQDAHSDGTSFAVLFMDNDYFKEVNDQYGHSVGDQLLIEVSHRIRAQLREGDLVARLGGDEFAVLLTPIHQVEDAERIAHKIIAAMAAPLHHRDQSIVPSLSIGIAVYPQHGDTPEQLVRAADRAMYHVKRTQRGTCSLAVGPTAPSPLDSQ
jgi:diguanylate cyclase (GGDEF)-like protein